MDDPFDCPHCESTVFPDELTCPACKGRLRYKTFKEAFWSDTGLGAFDLIPGIRDLPNVVRLILMFVTHAALGTLILMLLGFSLGFALLALVGGLIAVSVCRVVEQWIGIRVDG